MKQVVFGIETTGHYYEDLVHHCYNEDYHVRIVNAATTKEMRKMLSLPEKKDEEIRCAIFIGLFEQPL